MYFILYFAKVDAVFPKERSTLLMSSSLIAPRNAIMNITDIGETAAPVTPSPREHSKRYMLYKWGDHDEKTYDAAEGKTHYQSESKIGCTYNDGCTIGDTVKDGAVPFSEENMMETVEALIQTLRYIDGQLSKTSMDPVVVGDSKFQASLLDGYQESDPILTEEDADTIELLVCELEGLKVELEKAQSEADIADESLSLVSQRISTSTQKFRSFRQINCPEPSKRQAIQNLIQQQHQSLMTLESKLFSFASSGKRIDELEEALSSKASELESAREKTRSLEETLNRLEQANCELENEIKEAFRENHAKLDNSPGTEVSQLENSIELQLSPESSSPTISSGAFEVGDEKLREYKMEIAKLRRINNDHEFKEDTLEKIVQDQQQWMAKLETRLKESSRAMVELEEARDHSKALEEIVKRNEGVHRDLELKIQALTRDLDDCRPCLAIIERQLEISKEKEASIHYELAKSIDQKRSVERELEGKELHMQYMQGTIASLQRNLIRAQDEIAATKKERDKKMNSLATFEGQLQAASAMLAEREQEIKNLNQDLESSNNRMNDLLESLSLKTLELEDTLKRANVLEAKVEELEARNRELDEMTLPKMEELEEKLDQARRKEDDIRSQLAESEDRNAAFLQQIGEKSKEMKELESFVVSIKLRLNHMHEQVVAKCELSEEQQLRIAKLGDELKDSKDDLEHSNKNLKELKARSQDIEKLLSTKSQELYEAQEHSNSLEALVVQNEEMCLNLKIELQELNEEKKGEIAELHRQLDQAKEEVTMLRTKLDASFEQCASTRQVIEAKNQNIEKLGTSVANCHLKLAGLRQEIVVHIADKNSLEKTISSLKIKLNECNADVDAKKRQLVDFNKQREVTDSRISELEFELENMKKHFASNEDMSERIDEYQTAHATITKELIREQDAVADLQSKCKELQDNETTLRDKLADAIQLQESKTLEISAKEQLIVELKASVDSQELILAKAREDILIAGDAKARQQEEIKMLQNRLNEASTNLKEAERKTKEIKNGFEEKIAELQMLLEEEQGCKECIRRKLDYAPCKEFSSIGKNDDGIDHMLMNEEFQALPEFSVFGSSNLDETTEPDSPKASAVDVKDKRIAVLERELTEVRNELLSLGFDQSDYQNTIAELENQLTDRLSELNEKERNVKELMHPASSLQEMIGNLENSQSTISVKVDDLTGERDELLRKINLFQKEIGDLRDVEASLRGELERSACRQASVELDIKIKDGLINDLQESILTQQQQLQNSVEGRDKLKYSLHDRIQQLLKSLSNKNSELESALNYSESLEERLKQMEQTYQKTLKELDGAREVNGPRRDTEESEDVENSVPLMLWTDENIAAFLDCKKKDKRIRKLKGSVFVLNKRLAAKTVELTLSQQRSRSLEESNRILEQRLRDLTREYPNFEDECSSLGNAAVNVLSLAVGSAVSRDRNSKEISHIDPVNNVKVLLTTKEQENNDCTRKDKSAKIARTRIQAIANLLSGAAEIMSDFYDMVSSNMDIVLHPEFFADWQLIVFHFVSPILSAKTIDKEYMKQ